MPAPGVERPIFIAPTIAPVTIDPSTNEPITRSGSSIAIGIAPSVIPASPNSQVDFPVSISNSLNRRGASIVEAVTVNAETILTEAKMAYGP